MLLPRDVHMRVWLILHSNFSQISPFLNVFSSFTSIRSGLWGRSCFSCIHIHRWFCSLPWWKTEYKCLRPLGRGSCPRPGSPCQHTKWVFQQIPNSYTLGSMQASEAAILSQTTATLRPQSRLGYVPLLLTWSGPGLDAYLGSGWLIPI